MNNLGDRLTLDNEYEVVEIVSEAIRHMHANRDTSRRLQEAHDYCLEHLMPTAWGKNVWHSILDDAIRMRQSLQAMKDSAKAAVPKRIE